MRNKYIIFIFSILASQNLKGLSFNIEKFDFLLGNRFIGEYVDKNIETKIFESMSWEIALNGKAIRLVQVINKEFVIESIIMWDNQTDSLALWSFSSAGQAVKKVVDINNDTISYIEDVSANNNSIKKVKTSISDKGAGKINRKTRFLINNVWVTGSDVDYIIDSTNTRVSN